MQIADTFEIYERTETMTGSTQVRVRLSDTETAFFEFRSDPTQRQVDIEASLLLLERAAAELRAEREQLSGAA